MSRPRPEGPGPSPTGPCTLRAIKSALLMTMARHVALNLGLPTVYISAEYPAKTLRSRLLAGVAELAVHEVERLDLTNGQRDRLNEATARLDAADFDVHGEVNITLPRLERLITTQRRQQITTEREQRPVVFVDHLQAVLAAERRQEDPRDEDGVLYALKNLASRTRTPIIVTSWLSTSWAELRRRKDQRPTRLDVSEPIEQFADKVITVSRPNGNTMDLVVYDQADATFDKHGTVTLNGHFARVTES
ncbi:DnaB-like helicase C-terminal domain-containing protein [Streptosporangium sp. NPDC051022]|uniref:DnaB-like helicase C-terminal domain-containing protein n=1 Tax=Streptosporangium sp. NPDC051022 TaxID=3155752 RepID=UPI003416B24A